MIVLIAAVGENDAIGKDNQLLWKLKSDMKFFKTMTTGQPIIMGRKTFESLGKPLPLRTNIVVSKTLSPMDGVIVCSNIQEAIKTASDISDTVFVIGGQQIYRQTIDLADQLLITHVHDSPDADAFFPAIPEKFKLFDTLHTYPASDINSHSFTIKEYHLE